MGKRDFSQLLFCICSSPGRMQRILHGHKLLITGTINTIVSEHTLHSAMSEVTESKEEVVGEEKMLEKENVSKGAH